ncbi:hypothetical protein ACRALDRAFT_2059743 [Sodiomyces alcalophilus JCM 7366]|uniref:uncharacterized protein n=1 Tax=Sodiomyces alcalophilus JCM 7366 TaxID=591952 RepID=UPI0039B52F7D
MISANGTARVQTGSGDGRAAALSTVRAASAVDPQVMSNQALLATAQKRIPAISFLHGVGTLWEVSCKVSARSAFYSELYCTAAYSDEAGEVPAGTAA